MARNEDLVTSIDELPHFPFQTLSEFWDEYSSHRIEVQLDHGVVRQWALKSRQSPDWLQRVTFALTFSPYVFMLVYATIIILIDSWIYLLGLPLIYKGPDIFGPRATAMIPVLLLSFVALVVSIIFAIYGLLALSLCLLLLWQACNLVYHVPLKFLWNGGLNNEHVVCMFWQGNALAVLYPNDDLYSQRFKIVNGEHTSYS